MASSVLLTASPKRRPGRPRKPAPPPEPRPRRKPNTGSVTVKPNGRVYAQDIRDEDGRRESYEATGADVAARIADAERWLDGKIGARARLADRTQESVRAYFDRWLWETHRNAPASTLRVYRTCLRFASDYDAWHVAALTAAEINAITDGMIQAGYTARYAVQVRTTLRSALKPLVGTAFTTNPVGKYPGNLVIPRRRPNVLDEPDAADFEAVALETAWGLLWVLAVRYGLRGGELRALQRADLNLRTRELTVRHGMRAGRQLADTKNHNERTFKVAAAVVRALEAYLNDPAHPSPRWMFARPDGGAITNAQFDQAFAEIVAEVDRRRYEAAVAAGRTEIQAQQTALPRLTPHGLRHTAATLMLRGGVGRQPVSVAKVSQVLGHASPAFTYRMYSWAVPSDDDVMDAAIGGLLSPLPISGGVSAAWQHAGSN